MTDRSPIPRRMDIIDAIKRIRAVTAQIDIAGLEADWQRQWLLERGLEIISEASRHLPDDVKLRHPEIPWQRIAAVGNRLRHKYQRVLPDILWKIARDDLFAS